MPDRKVLRVAERHLRRADPVMAGLVDRIGPCRLDEVQRGRPFEALLESIVHQQLSMKAAATIYGRFRELFDGEVITPERVLQTPAGRLRRAGLSRQKIAYIRDLARRVADGRLSLRRLPRMDDPEVVEALTRVKGIGRWTAEMFLIFRLGRLDVLPVDDLGVRDAARLAYGLGELPGARQLRRLGEPWRPYRSVASWYLWQSRRAGGLGPEESGKGRRGR